METRWLYTTSENLPLLREASKETCVIPMVCIEKHGLHLPLGTDIIEASGVAFAAHTMALIVMIALGIGLGSALRKSPAIPARKDADE